MKNFFYQAVLVIFCVGLCSFGFTGETTAKNCKKGIPLKCFKNPNSAEMQENYNYYDKNNNERMTTLLNIKLLDKNKEKISEKIQLRAAQLLKENYETKASYYYTLAKAYEEYKKYNKAIENYKLAINSDLNYIPAYGNLGLLYAELGEYRDSINIFEKYITLSDNPEEKILLKEFIKKMSTFVNK